MWFFAHTHVELGHVQLRTMYTDEFPLFRHYQSGNTVGHYRYITADLSVGDVIGLLEEHVYILYFLIDLVV